jgi:neurocalcin delta
MGGKQTKSEAKLDKKSMSKIQSLIKGELSEDEIQCCYKTYQESRRSNKELTKEEFMKVYSGLFQCETTDFAEHVFRTFDLNNDGTVNFQEFLLGLCFSGSKDAETKITWAFKVYDIDGDGSISWSEMRNIIQVISFHLNKHITIITALRGNYSKAYVPKALLKKHKHTILCVQFCFLVWTAF